MMKLYDIWDLTQNNPEGRGIIKDKEKGKVKLAMSC